MESKRKELYKERSYIHKHRGKLYELLGNKCYFCDKMAEELHHLAYFNLPRDVKKHSKFLVPICKKHHNLITHNQILKALEDKDMGKLLFSDSRNNDIRNGIFA
jgi:hypothetical protein